MRAIACALVAGISLAAGTATAAPELREAIVRVATWSDQNAIVVEVESYDPHEEDAASGGCVRIPKRRTAWSFQKPVGVEQARINSPYTKPKLIRGKRSKLPAAELEAIVAALRRANEDNPTGATIESIHEHLPTAGIMELTQLSECAVRIKQVPVATASKSPVQIAPGFELIWGGALANERAQQGHCWPHPSGLLIGYTPGGWEARSQKLAFVPRANVPVRMREP